MESVRKGGIMKTAIKQFAPVLLALLMAAVCVPMISEPADASTYYHFNKPANGASCYAGNKVSISMYCGIVVSRTDFDVYGNPSKTSYEPVTLKIFKGTQELYSKDFTYTKPATITTSYIPRTTGTLKLRIYAKTSLSQDTPALQDEISLKVKKKKASAVKNIKPAITVERISKTAAQITCSNDNGFGMKVYRATKKNGKYKLVGKTSKSVFKDKKLAASKVYYYKVRLFAKSGKKTYLSKWSAKKKAEKYSAATGDITLTYSPSTGVKISWKAMKNIDYYDVGRGTNGVKGGYEGIGTVSSNKTTLYDKNVKSGQTYYYCVTGWKGDEGMPRGKYMEDKYKITIP